MECQQVFFRGSCGHFSPISWEKIDLHEPKTTSTIQEANPSGAASGIFLRRKFVKSPGKKSTLGKQGATYLELHGVHNFGRF